MSPIGIISDFDKQQDEQYPYFCLYFRTVHLQGYLFPSTSTPDIVKKYLNKFLVKVAIAILSLIITNSSAEAKKCTVKYNFDVVEGNNSIEYGDDSDSTIYGKNHLKQTGGAYTSYKKWDVIPRQIQSPSSCQDLKIVIKLNPVIHLRNEYMDTSKYKCQRDGLLVHENMHITNAIKEYKKIKSWLVSYLNKPIEIRNSSEYKIWFNKFLLEYYKKISSSTLMVKKLDDAFDASEVKNAYFLVKRCGASYARLQ